MTKTANWFNVDKDGLSKLVADKPKVFILHELLQNAWDQDVTCVRAFVIPSFSKPEVKIMVEDDDPEGFTDLAHAFTLFAESNKKGDPEKRGRFNLGEKLVLAVCRTAQIVTTKGGVEFNAGGRRTLRKKLEKGSLFTATVRMTREEMHQMMEDLQYLIPPVLTVVNRKLMEAPKKLSEFTITLPTQKADDQGVLRSTARKTKVRVYEVREDHQPHLYEMGIPVVPIDCKWHVDIQQKVPLNMDRDNVTPAYYAKVMAEVVNHMQEHMAKEDASSAWATAALEHKDISDIAVDRMMDLRFGEKRVSYDPSDPEANQTAASEGHTVVHGGTLSKQAWVNVRRASAMTPAGSKFATPKPFSPNGKPIKTISPLQYTKDQKEIVDFVEWLATHLINFRITVRLTDDRNWKFNGAYGDREMYLNLLRMGQKLNELIYRVALHELAHEFSGSHLDKEFYDALNKFAVQVTSLAMKHPERFKFLS